MDDRTGHLEGNRTLADVAGGDVYRTWPGARPMLPQPMQEPNYAPAQAIPGWAMPESAMAAGAEPNAPRLLENGGQWTLFEHGDGQRPLQPHEVGSAQNYVSDFWNAFGGRGGQVHGSGTANDPLAQQAAPPLGPAVMLGGLGFGQRHPSGGGGYGNMFMGAFGAPFGWMSAGGGRGSNGAVTNTGTWGWGGRNANRTLGELTNSPAGTDSSYGAPGL